MALELVAQPISSKAMPATLAIIVHFHQVRTERAAAAARLWSSRRTYPAFGDAVATRRAAARRLVRVFS